MYRNHVSELKLFHVRDTMLLHCLNIQFGHVLDPGASAN